MFQSILNLVCSLNFALDLGDDTRYLKICQLQVRRQFSARALDVRKRRLFAFQPSQSIRISGAAIAAPTMFDAGMADINIATALARSS